MLMEWFAREGHWVLSWWLVATLAGAAVLPLCLRLLNGLADRGVLLARPLGIVLIAFVYWLLNMLGFLQNNAGGVLLAWGIVAAISSYLFFTLPRPLAWRQYWRENRLLLIAGELLFIALFVGWAIFRAHQHDTASTEKPMDLMFISSIMRSQTFPPHDAWLAGYTISYYYFGYLMAAMFALVTHVSSTVAFSLTLAMWFALAGLGAFAVVINLVRAQVNNARWGAIGAGVLATVFVVLLSNFQFPLVEVPYQTGIGDTAYYDFWRTQQRVEPRAQGSSDPHRWDYWWWFRASRVLTDFELNGSIKPSWYAQPIDEFPQFSFLLGDVHPHVMALPFGILAMGLALNLLLAGRKPDRYDLVLYAAAVGALIFLNTWDILAYWTVLIGAEGLRRLVVRGRGTLAWEDIGGTAAFAVVFALLSFAFYSLFLYSFRSQAAGLVPNIDQPTYFPHFFLMFAPFLLLLGGYLVLKLQVVRRNADLNWLVGGTIIALVLGLGLFSLLVLVLRSALDPSIATAAEAAVNELGGWGQALPLLLARRLSHAPTTVLLALCLLVVLAMVFARPRQMPPGPVQGFALLVVGVGALIALIPEFVYLADVFRTRINTIFKFYYMVWVLWALASAYGVYWVLSHARSAATRAVYAIVVVVVLALGLPYAVFGVYARVVVEARQTEVTLDGGVSMLFSREDYLMARCLQAHVGSRQAVIVEATRDAYNPQYGRVATLTGIPTLLGWENHQRQWRGVLYNAFAGGRAQDVERLYSDARWETAADILQRYGVDYVVYGWTERNQYPPTGETKFLDNLEALCEFGGSRVYRVTADALARLAR